MPSVKISDMPMASSLNLTDIVPLVSSLLNKIMTIEALRDFIVPTLLSQFLNDVPFAQAGTLTAGNLSVTDGTVFAVCPDATWSNSAGIVAACQVTFYDLNVNYSMKLFWTPPNQLLYAGSDSSVQGCGVGADGLGSITVPVICSAATFTTVAGNVVIAAATGVVATRLATDDGTFDVNTGGVVNCSSVLPADGVDLTVALGTGTGTFVKGILTNFAP